MELALESPSLLAEIDDTHGDETLAYSRKGFARGQVLGDRYRVHSLLGRGGMGEVWRASDLKLRVDVALKALRQELLEEPRALDLLRQEVRVAREVISPNVCRVFDLVELEGQELVSMEYIDGITLLDILKMRAPLDLAEAREIASQFLAGLEAIHEAGLAHRDIKPENVMMTRSGRVVLMDFGIAKGLAEVATGTVSGTPAYMAPEHARGEGLDARADVFSAGVVLVEMIAPEGLRDFEARQQIWHGIHHEPPEVPDSPWAAVLRKAVAGRKEQRHASASALARALEEVTLRVAGAEDVTPYPGLASFTEADAEYFFGRELEVEEMWKKLRRPHLLGLIGPSGAGKSSFLRAGLLPVMPTGWRAVVTTPGSRPTTALAQALADEISGDPEAVRKLVGFEEMDVAVSLISRWRRQHDQALVIVDQFEELFTQNSLEVQTQFSRLLGRLALEADVHILLAMRDDFLGFCSQQESLSPIFSELTALKPLSGGAARRALVQPALKCGYRFEDDSLVDEMVGEVGHERGALPLLAFAAARLWAYRDREQGLLTREAYEHVGGVGGALAQHAEAALETIGRERIPVVRELFRNLVTAEGTRAARDREELLSVFEATGARFPVGSKDVAGGRPFVPVEQAPKQEAASADLGSEDRAAAGEVLDTLIDSRLLTSYEVSAGDDGDTADQRIEIIHESLLTNWPRLVRWQTQDADSAQLRDQVRQAAQMWEERGRPDDLLWTGTSFGEFKLWRDRYEGGLSSSEKAFGKAMVRRTERRRRRRRAALAATFAVLLGVLAVIGGFWRRSVAAANRAEAANLFSLAQLQLEEDPSAAIAYSIASLERADSSVVRRLALEALWRGPTEFQLATPSPYSLDFSPDGRWLATAGAGGPKLWPWDGGPPTTLEGSDLAMEVRISREGELLAANMDGRQKMGLWTFPEGRLLRSFSLGEEGDTYYFRFSRDNTHLIASTEITKRTHNEVEIRLWPVAEGEAEILARLETPIESRFAVPELDATWSRLAWADGRNVRIAPMDGTYVDLASTISVEHDRAVSAQVFDRQGRRLATADRTGTNRVWSLEHDPPELTHILQGAPELAGGLLFGPSGLLLYSGGGFLWDLAAPAEAVPLRLRPGSGTYGMAIDPSGQWLATGTFSSVSLWPLTRSYPRILPGHEGRAGSVDFTPDSARLVSTSADGSVRLWPVNRGSGETSRVLHHAEGTLAIPREVAVAPDGSFAVAGYTDGRVRVLPLAGGPIRELEGYVTDTPRLINALAVGPKSRLVAAASMASIRVWNLESEEVPIVDAGDGKMIATGGLEFTNDGDLWVESGTTIRRWKLEADQVRIIEEIDLSGPELASDRLCGVVTEDRQALLLKDGRLRLHDLASGESREVSSHASPRVCLLQADSETVVTTDAEGGIRVGRVTDTDPHLLLGRERGGIAVSPDGHWIASGGADSTIRLWPMPDLSKPPLHTLPREDLIAQLETLTNLRAVPDESSPTGWKIDVGPFPGWENVPTW